LRAAIGGGRAEIPFEREQVQAILFRWVRSLVLQPASHPVPESSSVAVPAGEATGSANAKIVKEPQIRQQLVSPIPQALLEGSGVKGPVTRKRVRESELQVPSTTQPEATAVSAVPMQEDKTFSLREPTTSAPKETPPPAGVESASNGLHHSEGIATVQHRAQVEQHGVDIAFLKQELSRVSQRLIAVEESNANMKVLLTDALEALNHVRLSSARAAGNGASKAEGSASTASSNAAVERVMPMLLESTEGLRASQALKVTPYEFKLARERVEAQLAAVNNSATFDSRHSTKPDAPPAGVAAAPNGGVATAPEPPKRGKRGAPKKVE
jgi:hypothetical protein